ncbi:MAG TPA: glycerol-3-phosphate dehydrogenase [Oleiagrimonas sp.]|nr:glycerol-3-phosphate dehydrogenase [Oleiagrimonas sp.]
MTSTSATIANPASSTARFDMLVVGGGINGTAIARDAAGRGVSVCLCEADDLAAHASSASTKLIHGGLRYLEQFAFGLVHEALVEREVMLRTAPHLVRPLRFVLPHEPHLRPAWQIRAGLFLYDHLDLGRRTLSGSGRIGLDQHAAGNPLQDHYRTGFVYSDAQVQDARLTVLNALDAEMHGARILTRTRCTHAERSDDGWTADLQRADGRTTRVHAKTLINATGPRATRFLDTVAHVPHQHQLRLIKGSHIVVPKLYPGDHAYTFQLPDRRIVFAIPYEHDWTLIGTTDIEYHGDPFALAIDDDEVTYLCAAINCYFKRSISPADVHWSYSGVRPLVDDRKARASEITRGYQLELDAGPAPLLSVFGGKVTTARHLAEDAMARLRPHLPGIGESWTRDHALPGGERRDLDTCVDELCRAHPWLVPEVATRWIRSYGTRSERILGSARSMADLGPHFGGGLHAAEVDYLCREEWAREVDDIIWRRSKLGLRMTPGNVEQLAGYLAALT